MIPIIPIAVGLVALGSALFSGCSEEETCEDKKCGDGNSSLTIPARPKNWSKDVLTPTGKTVNPGDYVTISAEGSWNVGLGYVGPEGGAEGKLVGRVGEDGDIFDVGEYTRFKARESGEIFLGADDNPAGECDGYNPGSCYADNFGALCVCVNIERIDPGSAGAAGGAGQ